MIRIYRLACRQKIMARAGSVLLTAFLVLFLTTSSQTASSTEHLSAEECYSCHKTTKKADLDARHRKVFFVAREGSLETQGCEACHGAGGEHKKAVDKDEKEMRIETFREGIGLSEDKNGKCLPCHKGGDLNFWKGSGHDMAGVSCASCHTIHGKASPVRSAVCFKCHPQRRAQYQRSSHMPVREGLMECSSCHNPHGSSGPNLLKKASVNETCYDCHQDKRGPFLWEHLPARENCVNCHEPHGSNHASLLKTRVPYLCQSCHATQGHPSTIYEGGGVAGGSANRRLLAKGCLNCHPLVHGSNHPSGTRLTR